MMRYKPMLAQSVGDYSRITKEEWESGLYIQPKLDGVRCLIQYDKEYGVKAYSRTGKPWLNIDHILMNLYDFFQEFPHVVLDGELYNHDLKKDFEKIISLVRKTKPTLEDRLDSEDMVQFHCYDMIDDDNNTSFGTRNEFLVELASINSVHTLNTFGVYNTEEVEACHEDFLNQGYEGSILRKNEPYECKRSWTLMKVKDFHDSEAKIIDWVEGKGKRIGTIGKFMAVDADGNQFGMPVMDKFKYLQDNFVEMQGWVGKIATFTYFERTKANSYRHPLFKAIRNYE
jgi:DNA ligase-1